MFGFHGGVGGNHTGIGAHWAALNAAGVPFFFKSTDGYHQGAAVIARNNPHIPHLVIFRLTTAGQNDGYDYDVPPYHMSALNAAAHHWQKTKAKLPPELDRDFCWVEPINEVDKNKAGWIGQFMTEIALLANAEGYKITGPAWSSGEPEPAHWETPGMLRWLRYCANNRGLAAVAVHEYDFHRLGWNHPDVTPWHVGRFLKIFETCTRHNIDWPDIHITEAGWSLDQIPSIEQCLADLDWSYRNVYGPYRQWVKGLGLWCLQRFQGNIHNQVQKLIAPVTSYMLNLPEVPPAPGPGPEPPAPGVKRVVFKLAQEHTLPEWHRVTDAAHAEYKRTMTASADDAIIILRGGNAESYAVIFDPELPSQAGTIERLTAAGLSYRTRVLRQLGIQDITDSLMKHPTKRYVDRPLADVTTVTIHHTVSNTTPEAIARFHVETRDWPGIGYHFVIMADGTIYQTNRLTTKSFHAGSYAAPGDENHWSIGLALMGNFTNAPPPQAQQDAAKALVNYLKSIVPSITRSLPHRGMPGANTQCPGNTWQSWYYYVTGETPPAPPPPPNTTDMAQYFLPPNNATHGDIFILSNNWGGGNERVQLQREGNVSYLTKNQQYEKRRIDADKIYLLIDTSPGNGQYYTVESTTGWMPRHWSPGGTFTRQEVTKFYRKDNCNLVSTSNWSTPLTFERVHTSWTSQAGIVLTNVVELFWTAGGRVDERYWFAPGLGLVAWEKYTGQRSWISELIPRGQQGDNVRESGCFA